MTRYEKTMGQAEQALENARKSKGIARCFWTARYRQLKRNASALTLEQAAEETGL